MTEEKPPRHAEPLPPLKANVENLTMFEKDMGNKDIEEAEMVVLGDISPPGHVRIPKMDQIK